MAVGVVMQCYSVSGEGRNSVSGEGGVVLVVKRCYSR